ncbi:MAG: hypothetical protein LBS84_02580 [Clostridiales bacterium]|jgi:hypothetical protein|nr:hypothetical protein [Clostridiales bacterium]
MKAVGTRIKALEKRRVQNEPKECRYDKAWLEAVADYYAEEIKAFEKILEEDDKLTWRESFNVFEPDFDLSYVPPHLRDGFFSFLTNRQLELWMRFGEIWAGQRDDEPKYNRYGSFLHDCLNEIEWEDRKRLFDEFEAALSDSDKLDWPAAVMKLEEIKAINNCYTWNYLTGQSLDFAKKEKIHFPDRLTGKEIMLLVRFFERYCGLRMC